MVLRFILRQRSVFFALIQKIIKFLPKKYCTIIWDEPSFLHEKQRRFLAAG